MNDVLFDRIERITVLLALAIGIVSAFGATPKWMFSAVVGAAMMVGNAAALRYLAKRVSAKKGSVLLFFPFKMFVLMGLVAMALHLLHLAPIPFLLGVSTLPVAVIVASLLPQKPSSPAEEALLPLKEEPRG